MNMRNLIAFSSGLLFAFGLGLGQMTQPARVIGFLDVFRAWDPTLLFVMAGAVIVYTIAFRLVLRRPRPLLDTRFWLPARQDIDPKLVAGSALFGVGWGLAGFCPGPALTAVVTGNGSVVAFVGAMAVGMLVQWTAKADE